MKSHKNGNRIKLRLVKIMILYFNVLMCKEITFKGF